MMTYSVSVFKLNVATVVADVVTVDAYWGCTGIALVYSCDVYHFGLVDSGYGWGHWHFYDVFEGAAV